MDEAARPRRSRLVEFSIVAVAVTFTAVACGGPAAIPNRASSHDVARLDRPVPGAPNTPRWLRIRIWRVASGLGDAEPDRIVVRLHLRERGRIIDRVWMRGDFVCHDCTYPPGGKAPRGHLAGFSVIDSTRRSLSFSISPG